VPKALVIVTVDTSQGERVREVAERLRQAGMEVEQVLESIGIITGRFGADSLAGLETVPGIIAVEASGEGPILGWGSG
jgi:hypothetical protein